MSGGRPSVYGLYDANGRLRYIGKANSPEARLKTHMRDSRRRDTPLYRWIRKNGTPQLRILETDCVDWREAERRLITAARARGEKLLNLADGGDEPFCPPEVRRANGLRSAGPTGYLQRVRSDRFTGLIHTVKREFASSLRLFQRRGDEEAAERMRNRMRTLASRLSEHFPNWTKI